MVRQNAGVNVLTAGTEDLPVLAATLADAFSDDPVWCWLIPERGRQERLMRVFATLLGHGIAHGQVMTTVDRQSVAMWSAPGQWKLPPLSVLRATPHLVRAAGAHLPRLLRRLGEVERAHSQQPQQHQYLEIIGTAAAARGLGHGTALLQEAFARLPAMPIYLESSTARNLPFYLRHGFEVTGGVSVSSGPPQWTLWRD